MQDPMSVSVDIEGIDSNIPCLPESELRFQVTESTIEANKDKNGLNWKLKLVTTEPTRAMDGRDLKPGFPTYVTCALQARQDSTDPEAFKRNISDTVDALFHTDKTNRQKFTRALADAAVGRFVVAHVYPDEYPEGSGKFNTKVKRLKKAE